MTQPVHISTVLTRQITEPLREYQSLVVTNVYAQWQNYRSVLLVSPTGSGKTRMAEEFVWLARSENKRVLFIVHRRELLRQTAQRLRKAFGDLNVGIIAPKEELNLAAPIQVATVQTLLARGNYPEADLVIFDEAHHYVADDWIALSRHYSTAKVLGLTATPERQDGKPLGDIFESLIVAAQYSELLQQGYLVPCRVFQPPAEYLGDGLAQKPLTAWQRYAENSQTFAFCHSVKSAYEFAEELRKSGVTAETVEANTPKVDRDSIVDRFRVGEIKVLTNVGVFTEGTDVPEARCMLLAAQCQHVGGFLQRCGRVLRPAPNKKDAILIDLTGATLRHGFPTEDRLYSLDGDGIKRTSVTPLRNCLKCGATFPAWQRKCPECGYEPPIEERHVKIWDFELRAVFAGVDTPVDAKTREYQRLRELGRARGWSLYFVQKEYKKLFGELPKISDASIEERRLEYARLAAIQQSRGFKPGFVKVRYREMFGDWPGREVTS